MCLPSTNRLSAETLLFSWVSQPCWFLKHFCSPAMALSLAKLQSGPVFALVLKKTYFLGTTLSRQPNPYTLSKMPRPSSILCGCKFWKCPRLSNFWEKLTRSNTLGWNSKEASLWSGMSSWLRVSLLIELCKCSLSFRNAEKYRQEPFLCGRT